MSYEGKEEIKTPGINYANGAGTIAIIGCGIAAIVLFIRSTITTSDLIGNTENWRAIKPQRPCLFLWSYFHH